MAIPNGVKVGVAVAALAGAGFFVWRNASETDSNDFMLNQMTQFFSCDNNHEFNLPAKEVRRIAAANDGQIRCPQCSALAGERFQCPNCQKLIEPVGHGNIPSACPHCKQKI